MAMTGSKYILKQQKLQFCKSTAKDPLLKHKKWMPVTQRCKVCLISGLTGNLPACSCYKIQ